MDAYTPSELAIAVTSHADTLCYDPYSGQPRDGSAATPARRGALVERSAGARAGLEPPRFCPLCGRRMRVQVAPMGWEASCSRHGGIDSAVWIADPWF